MCEFDTCNVTHILRVTMKI